MARREIVTCRACGRDIPEKMVHRVRIVLTNAVKEAPPAAVDKEDDFHHACAASIFAVFDGRDLHPGRPTSLPASVSVPGGDTDTQKER